MKLFEKIDKPIFGISVGAYLLIFLFIAAAPGAAERMITDMMNVTLYNAGEVYIIGYAVILIVLFIIALGKFGRMKLGKPEDKPEYSFGSWIAMLVGAGIGCGLVFYGVNEPVTHFMTSPYAEPGTADAARDAMRLTFYHWGVMPWGIYTVTGLCVGWFVYRRGLPNLISSGFYPMLGERIHKAPGKIIDAFSLIAVICGVSMSVGFAAVQFCSGLHSIYGVSNSAWVIIGVIVFVGILGTLSAVSGVAKGIQWVSNLNMYLIYFFIIFAFLFGSSVFLVKTLFQGVGDMIFHLPETVFFADSFAQIADSLGFDWVGGWTVFYWAWWVAFAPFVGGFLAKISKGRTVREFILSCILVPACLCFVWFTFFGGEAIHMSLFEGSEIAVKAVADINSSVFFLLEEMPLGKVTIPVMMLLIITLIVTSINSAMYMAGEYSMGQNGEPTLAIRGFWGAFVVINTSLFIYLGGLPILKNTAIVLAFPFMLIVLLMVVNVWKDMKLAYGEEFSGKK